MKKNWICILGLFVTALLLQSCSNKQNSQAEGSAPSEDTYTCPMDPQVLEHHPGNCPVCGMKLVKKGTVPAVADGIELESLLKPANEFVITSLPVTTPQKKNVTVPLKVYGTIEYDTRAAGSISSRVSGRIEKLYLRYRYQEVAEGQKIMEIYSPELETAQQNLLFLLKSDPENASFINAARQRLLLLGMSENELNDVIKKGQPLYKISVYSNYTGHVHDAGMSNDVAVNDMNGSSAGTQELSLKEGMYVQKGQTLFMIMNHHRAWAALQIFPKEQNLITEGVSVRIIPEVDTAAVISGKIDFIEPFFRDNSKTLTARVYFHNMDMLPIGSHVIAEIYSGGIQGLWLPASAVLSLGANEVAFKKEDGGFIAHKITTGIRANDNVQILSGLSITDTVAMNAQYLMDSESFIKSVSK